ncbi:hypothetical protein STCU_12152 [Strigomonas culicis]|uniref:Uncharacterized protein n=1 Tax=Strigomonas culicis TaxID=28005 RepID=S9TBA5_9TRYP|nr:hypothetical protein STCU_12152 [Strigomonas culicis]|eukprot:EPY15292.1 hypothetical protein STCU_12152 [Strigomonas culicis]
MIRGPAVAAEPIVDVVVVLGHEDGGERRALRAPGRREVAQRRPQVLREEQRLQVRHLFLHHRLRQLRRGEVLAVDMVDRHELERHHRAQQLHAEGELAHREAAAHHG